MPGYSPSPLHSLPALAEELNLGHVLVKNESSRLGLPAFKVLGASWTTAQAVAKKLDLPVSAASIVNNSAPANSLSHLAVAAKEAKLTLYAATDGNHGRAVARMARYLGIDAQIYVPYSLDEEAKSNIESEGAIVVVEVGKDYDQTVVATEAAAESHPNDKGVLVSDTALELGDDTAQWMVEGYQTMFDELEEQLLAANLDRTTHVITPVGVGSLCQATVTHFRRTNAEETSTVMTVEPETAACLKASLEAGHSTSVQTAFTICTGMCCGTLSASAWPILKDGVSVAMAVDDIAVHKAVLELMKYGIRAGPCGAATLAGLRLSTNDERAEIAGLGKEAVVVLLCTEGTRSYKVMQ